VGVAAVASRRTANTPLTGGRCGMGGGGYASVVGDGCVHI